MTFINGGSIVALNYGDNVALKTVYNRVLLLLQKLIQQCCFLFRQFINGGGIVAMPKIAIPRDNDVRDIARRFRPTFLSHQSATHSFKIHPRGVEIWGHHVQVGFESFCR